MTDGTWVIEKKFPGQNWGFYSYRNTREDALFLFNHFRHFRQRKCLYRIVKPPFAELFRR